MFVIPFFIRNNLESVLPIRLVQITIFMENRGKNLIQIPEGEIEEWLALNGIVGRVWKQQEYAFIEVDCSKTTLSEFYSFEQLTMEQSKGTEECWRTFYWMVSKEEKEETHWNECLEEYIRKPFELLEMNGRF